MAGGGIGGTGITSGPITGFGSVFVNGLELDTSAAGFTINGAPGSEDMLDVGMVVTVHGDLDQEALGGTAAHVSFEFDVIGVIEEIDPHLGLIRVAGQSVRYDDLTVFKGTEAAAFQGGDYIAVSGLADADSTIIARYITRATPGQIASPATDTGGSGAYVPTSSGGTGGASDSVAAIDMATIEGFVRDLDTVQRRFLIGTLVVDYATAQFADLAEAALTEGLLLRVTGRKGTPFRAAYIEPRGIASVLAANKDIIIDGLVTALDLPNGLTLKGSAISMTTETRIHNGQLADIQLNTRVKLVGRVDDRQRIIATDLWLLQPSVFMIVADVGAVNLAARQFRLLGIDVTVNSSTVFLDRSPLGLRRFSPRDIGIGDRLAVIGYRHGTGIVARRVDRLPGIFTNTVLLRGPVDSSADEGSLTLLDRTIDISQLRDQVDLLDATGTPISREDMVSQLQAGALAVVVGSYNGTAIDPTRISLQQPN